MNISSLNQHVLDLYESEETLYRLAGSLCRVVEATERAMKAKEQLEQPDSMNITNTHLTILRQMVTVGEKVQETACDWMNVIFRDVAEENGECNYSLMTSFCLKVHIVNAYLDGKAIQGHTC